MAVSKRRLLSAVILVVTAGSLPATTDAYAKDSHKSIGQTYTDVRVAVVKKFGTRAPGRNIRRYGIRYDVKQDGKSGPWAVRNATTAELKQSLGQLRRLLRPALSLLERRAVPPPQAPAGVMTSSQRAPAGGTLASIRACESGGNYATNTGNGFYGAYQFTQSTWASVGGSGNPANASPAEQDKRAAMLYAREGAGPWPVCGR